MDTNRTLMNTEKAGMKTGREADPSGLRKTAG